MPANEENNVTGVTTLIETRQSNANFKTPTRHSPVYYEPDDFVTNICCDMNSLSNGDEEVTEGSFETLPERRRHEKFIRDAVEIIIREAVFEGTSRNNPVVEWIEPTELPNLIDLSPAKTSADHDTLLRLMSSVIRYSVKTGHPHFINQLYSSLDPYGLVGQWLTDALNPSVYTYEVSPVFSLMEEAVLKEMRIIVGWKDGDGIFCPGGSMSNGYAMNLARHWSLPNCKEHGLVTAPRLVVFTSEDAHYSVKKLAAFLGIGNANVYAVKVDDNGKLRIDELRRLVDLALAEGAKPLMVSATAGTTVLGAFDQLRPIAELCREYGMWLHVDAAWGGGALMSRKHRRLLDGVELADSVTWNPHKLLAAPQQCSTLLVRHKNLLQSAYGSKASYLFQQDKFYDTSYDYGDKHIQCGRRADVLKFWLMWKAKGTEGLERHVDRLFQLSRYFVEVIRRRTGWQLLYEPECTNVCFRYTPPSKRHLTGDELLQALHKIAPIIKSRMVKKGSMLITYQSIRNEPNFFRLVLQNSALTEDDMQFFVDEIERLAEDL